MKFSQIARGKLQRLPGIDFTSIDGGECIVDLALLTGEDDADIITAADTFCKGRGLDPKPGLPAYDFAVAVEKVFRSALDPESPIAKPERFFASADDVRKGLDRDRINYLCSAQEVFQNRVSPLRKSMSEAEFTTLIYALAATGDGDDRPFLTLPRSTLIDVVRFGTQVWGISPKSKSPIGSIDSSASSIEKTTEANSPELSSSDSPAASEP